MSEHFIKLNCDNCGGKLDVYDDMERFACGYCGTQMLVQRRGGTVALTSVVEAIHNVQAGTDRTAAELALVRLKPEFERLEVELRSAEFSSGEGRQIDEANYRGYVHQGRVYTFGGIGAFVGFFIYMLLSGTLAQAWVILVVILVLWPILFGPAVLSGLEAKKKLVSFGEETSRLQQETEKVRQEFEQVSNEVAKNQRILSA